MRSCKIYRCATMDQRMCCHDCAGQNCENRCLNHPDRCRCVSVGSVNKSNTNPPKYDRAQILALAKSGYTNKEIMDKMGCSKSTVVSALARARFKRVGWGKEGLHE